MTNVIAPQKQLFTSMISLPLSLSPLSLSLFVNMMLNVNRNPKAYSRNVLKGRGCVTWWGKSIYIYLSLHCHHIVQELCEIRGGCPGLSVLTSLLVSVDEIY